MNKENTNSKSKKWTKDQIEALIDAFKDEQCLDSSDLTTYHNKHLCEEALDRVCQKVVRLRPTTTKDECQKKFKNIRNQFNIENAKVKASLKSGTVTDDVYKPNLWYYSLLLFLDTYVTPRKSRNSLEQDVQYPVSQSSMSTMMYVLESQILTNEDSDSLDQQQFQLCTDGTNITLIPVLPPTVSLSSLLTADTQKDSSSSVQHNTTSPATSTSSTSDAQQVSPLFISAPMSSAMSTSSNSDAQQNNSTFIPPGPVNPALSTASNSDAQQNNSIFIPPGPISPALSTSSTSGISSGSPRRFRKRNRQDLTEDNFSGTINKLAESLQQPIVVSNTQDTRLSSENLAVNGFLSFIGALLKRFQNEELRLEVMNNVTQSVMNAKSLDFQRAKE